MSQNEIYNALNSIYEGKEFKSFINIIRTFISLYKAKYQDEKANDIEKIVIYKHPSLKVINISDKFDIKTI